MNSRNQSHVEQDFNISKPGDELPTYDDLAQQGGPNSRFGRWRGWIEKRAAERYADITPEERRRRRERGWDPLEQRPPGFPIPEVPGPSAHQALQLTAQTAGLSIKTQNIPFPEPHIVSPPLPFVGSRIHPSHLKANHFGSRFLPHATSQIRCMLPLAADSLLLIGHDEGLSVMDMFPTERTESGEIIIKGPGDAEVRQIWKGESVQKIDIVEAEDVGDGTPHGVVLILTGQDGEDGSRSVKMYSLASLTSLAKWAVATKPARPIDLHQSAPPNVQQSPPKKFRPQSGIISRGLKSLIDPQGSTPTSERSPHPARHLQSPSPGSGSSSPLESWDMIDDLPLRWATDFVSLTNSGSRLSGASVISYALWVDSNRRGKGGRFLAIATKTSIYLYETPKGERAFRYVKEFYTPLQPRSITFIQQSVDGSHNHNRSDSTKMPRHHSAPRSSIETPTRTMAYGSHLSLFVVFDKKASWIRLADSAVEEVELYGSVSPNGHSHHTKDTIGATLSSASMRITRLSFDSSSSSSSWWILPVRCECPKPGHPGARIELYLLTRGKTTHIVPCPLPPHVSQYPPLKAISWNFAPNHVSARVCLYPNADVRDDASVYSFIQVVAFGEEGLEVQEISLTFLLSQKGKGKERLEEPVRAFLGFGGGDAGYLCSGGRWDKPWQRFGARQHGHGYSSKHSSAHPRNKPQYAPWLERSHSTSSAFITSTTDTLTPEMLQNEFGTYGWYRKGMADWRIFWVGGSGIDDDTASSHHVNEI